MNHSITIRKCQGLLFLLLVALLLVACTTVEAPGPSPFPYTIQIITPTHPSDAPECQAALCCFHCNLYPVQRVIDGDTFVSGRNRDGLESRVRLYGVDTPEWGEPCFEEGTERLRELAGDRVRIEFGPRSEDRYSRALFYVYTEAGESVAEKLIQEGLGKAWERDGQHRELLMAVEDGAERNGKRGLS